MILNNNYLSFLSETDIEQKRIKGLKSIQWLLVMTAIAGIVFSEIVTGQ